MSIEKATEYFKGDDLAASVWKSKYAAENEETPDDMHLRMAKEFARIDYTYQKNESDKSQLSHYGKTRNPLTEDSIFNLFRDFKYIVPQGSIMSTLGTSVIASLSNCYVIPEPYDSYAGILHTDSELAQLYKRRGGVGTGVSSLRPNGIETNNVAKTSTGAVSFMSRFSNTTREVAMNGRRGALMLTLDCRHPDVFEFVNVKKDRTKVTGANISVLLRNDFMEAVKSDSDYILRFPCDREVDENFASHESVPYNALITIDDYATGNKLHYKKIKAKELYNQIVENAWENAEPGQIFIDRVTEYCPDGVYLQYRPKNPNPCQPANATILTPTGIKQLGDINIGDVIWSGESWTTVLNKWATGVKPVYKYSTSTGYFLGTENHKVVENGVKIEVKDAEKIDWNVGDSTILFGNLDTQTIMDGIVLGDGSVHKASNNLLYLLVGDKDQDYFNSEIKYLIVKHRPGLTPKAYEIITTLDYTDVLKTYDRVIPDRFFYGNEATKRAFLRGLYTANGSVTGGRITLKQTSKILIEQVREMLSSLGIHSYITVNKPSEIVHKNGTYTSRISYDLNINSGRTIFKEKIGFIQTYKQEKIVAGRKPVRLSSKISDKEYIGEQEVFDITVADENHTYWTGGVLVSNCAEEFLQPYDSCRLMLMNLFSFVDNPFTKNATLNYDKLYEVSYEMMRLGDNLVDLEIEHIDRIIEKIKNDPEPECIKNSELQLWIKIRETALSARRFGGGITALADMLAALNLKYDEDDALSIIRDVMHVKMKAELACTIDLAILRGTFKDWDASLEYDEKGEGQNTFYKFIQNNFGKQVGRMKKYGRRNVSWNTISPAGSVSTQTQTTSGCEPLFSPFYIRRKKINAADKNLRVDFIDASGDKWTEFPVLHPKFKEWIYINYKGEIPEIMSKERLQELFEKSPYYLATANDISWTKRVEIQSILQQYTTNAISSTINLPNNVSKEEVYEIYLAAYNSNCKGVTVYRDGCRTGVLVTESPKHEHTSFTSINAIKRPKKLKSNVHTIVSKGVKWNVIVGMLEEKPYEVFAIHAVTDRKDNCVTFKGGGKYTLYEGENIIVDDITSGMNHEEETITRLISTNLRHGTDVKFLVEQLNKTNGEITSFSKAIARTLKTYIPSGTISSENCPVCSTKMVFEEGCKKCKSCGYSAC